MVVPLGVGDVLAEAGDLTVRRLSRASTWQKTYGGTIERALLSTGAVTEEVLIAALSQAYGLPGVSRATLVASDPDIVECLPAKERRRFRAFPFALSGKRLRIATSDPRNLVLLKNLADATGFEVELHVTPDPVLEDLIESFEGQAARNGAFARVTRSDGRAGRSGGPRGARRLHRPPGACASRRGAALRRDGARARSGHARRIPAHVRRRSPRRHAASLARPSGPAHRVVPGTLPASGRIRRRGEGSGREAQATPRASRGRHARRPRAAASPRGRRELRAPEGGRHVRAREHQGLRLLPALRRRPLDVLQGVDA